ncbi:ribonuclease HIII [Granulicatella balaenopterae]|uniref:Ribonuclease HIII n=1 Tax=Granulicatella balaenopterae TaxID=137733 RepID=A0A1H9KTK3_9LACT|nr:ribonuclease HIII [Granulicatella balaenopterae]SER02501.1 ribonuclease HIII [Granulicatella balaenopterae]
MSQAVIKLTNQQIEAMGEKYKAYKAKTPPYAHYQLKLPDVTITAYQSGKTVIQGLGVDAFLQTENLSASESEATKKSSLPKGFSTWSVMGSDEVGNGSYFGPLTVCSAYVSSDKIDLLKELGVKDSKALSDKQIRDIAQLIKVTIPYKLLVLWPEKYNSVQQTKNAHEMKVLLHNQALQLLTKQLDKQPQAYLIDQFCKPETYFRYLKGQESIIRDNLYFETKGEGKHIAVAAASIIARAAFLDGLETLEKKYGTRLPSGANAVSDQVAAKILKQGGMETLGKVAKLHFANTKKAQQLASKSLM